MSAGATECRDSMFTASLTVRLYRRATILAIPDGRDHEEDVAPATFDSPPVASSPTKDLCEFNGHF